MKKSSKKKNNGNHGKGGEKRSTWTKGIEYEQTVREGGRGMFSM
jgi:hypothetical protein